MKVTFLKNAGAAALAILLMAMFAPVGVSAQEKNEEQQSDKQTQAENSPERNRSERLVGTWEEQVTIRNCQTGAAIRTFASTTTFMSGGTLLDSTSGIPQALKAPGQGVWSYAGGSTYLFKFKVFNFDAGGNFTGWQIVRQQLQLNHQADQAESAGTSEIYAPNGTLLLTGCSTTTATRF